MNIISCEIFLRTLSIKQVQVSNVLLGLVVAVIGALGAIVALGVDAL